ncbi:unnamed protein product, partial [Protopolystoma xenopodis]
MVEKNNTTSQIDEQDVEAPEIPEVQNELSKVATNPKQTPTTIAKPVEDNSRNLPEIPKLPEAPKLEVPVQLPPPPPPAPSSAPLPNKVAEVPKFPSTTNLEDNSNINKSSDISISSPLPVGIAESDAEKKRRETKRKSSIILIAGFNIAVAHALDKIVPPAINPKDAAADKAVATNIQNLAQTINNGPGTEDMKIAEICSGVMNAIPDK